MTVRLSVIMPVYNAAPYLDAALESVLTQLGPDDELVAVDDGSTDGSWELLERQTDPRLKKTRQENQGAAMARNQALDLAAGDYLAFVDADDIALPGRFESPLRLMAENPDLCITGAGVRLIDQNGAALRDEITPQGDTNLRWITLFNSPFTFSTVTVRASALRFDPSVIPAEDYAYCADQLDQGRGVIQDEVLAAYRVHSGQVTKRKNDLLRESGNRISRRKIKERLGVDLPLDLVFLMRHLQAFGWERLSPEHHGDAQAAEATLFQLFALFKQDPSLDGEALAAIKQSLLRRP